jgi:hypothetical protein
MAIRSAMKGSLGPDLREASYLGESRPPGLLEAGADPAERDEERSTTPRHREILGW